MMGLSMRVCDVYLGCRRYGSESIVSVGIIWQTLVENFSIPGLLLLLSPKGVIAQTEHTRDILRVVLYGR
jgi:hypothetical protein